MENKTSSLSVPLALLAVFLLLVMIFILMLYRQPWIIIGLTSAIYLTLITLMFLWSKLPNKRRKVVSPTDEQPLKALKSLFAQLAVKTRKPDPYHIPWYFSICGEHDNFEPQMRAMGFEPLDKISLLGITLWLRSNAVMVVINQEDKALDKGLAAFAEFIIKYRARQPMNGILLNLPLPFILSDNSALLSDKAASQRLLIAQLNQLTGLKLPVYCSVTELSALKDFCESFALGAPVEEEAEQHPLLGALTSEEQGDDYDEKWFEQSFDGLFTQLYQHHQHRMLSVVQTASIKVIAAAPFQFYEIKPALKRYLSTVFEPVQNSQKFIFRGYFFSSAGQSEQQLDQLSFHVANRLGYNSIPVKPSAVDKPPLFSGSLFEGIFQQESPLVGSRVKANRSYILRKLCGYGLIVGGFLFSSGLIYLNYQFYADRDQKALAMLEGVSIPLMDSDSNHPQIGVFEQMSDTLWQLKKITQEYQGSMPAYIVSWLPGHAVRDKLDLVYQQLNSDYLLTLLRRMMEEKIWQLLSRSDTSGEVYMQYHQKYKALFNREGKARKDHDLITFYAEMLPLTVETSEPVKILLQDLMLQGSIAEDPDEIMLAQLEKRVIGKDFPRYIYNTLMAQAPFAQMVDMKPALDSALFTFTQINKAGLQLPYAYTKDGFAQLNQVIRDGELDRLIEKYRHLLSLHELRSIKHRVYSYITERYVAQYIGAWQSFEKHSQPLSSSSTELINQRLAELVQQDSVLDNYYGLILYHTTLLPGSKAPEQLQVATLLGKVNISDQQQKRQETMARHITTAFDELRSWQGNNSLKKHYAAVSKWLSRANNHQDLVAALLNKEGFPYFTGQVSTPLYATRLSQQIQQDVNKLNMKQVKVYLNERWQADVLSFYQQKLKDRFPFQHLSQQEVKLADFKVFFGTDGTVEQFIQRYLSNAKTSAEGALYLPDFIGSKRLVFAAPVSDFIGQSRLIQSVFFRNNELSVDVFLRVKQMSPELLSLSVVQERRIFKYQHGPKFRHELHWPFKGSADVPLIFVTQDHNGYVETRFSGVWSWFRWSYQDYFSRQGDIKTNAHQLTLSLLDQQVEIAVETSPEMVAHPLDPRLFLNYKVPALL